MHVYSLVGPVRSRDEEDWDPEERHPMNILAEVCIYIVCFALRRYFFVKFVLKRVLNSF